MKSSNKFSFAVGIFSLIGGIYLSFINDNMIELLIGSILIIMGYDLLKCETLGDMFSVVMAYIGLAIGLILIKDFFPEDIEKFCNDLYNEIKSTVGKSLLYAAGVIGLALLTGLFKVKRNT